MVEVLVHLQEFHEKQLELEFEPELDLKSELELPEYLFFHPPGLLEQE